MFIVMKKILLVAIIFIVLTLLFIKIPKKPVEQKLQKVTMMVPFLPTVSWSPYYAALNKGYYKDEGLEVDLQFTPKGNAGSVEQLIGKKVDIIDTGEESLIMSRSKGSKIVAIYPMEPVNVYYIISEKDKNIVKPADLIGKKIGVSSFGSGTYFNIQAILKAENIDKNQVEIIDAGNTLVAAFFENKFDAVSVHLNMRVPIESKSPNLNVIKASDYSGISRGHIATTEDFIKNNPVLIEKFLRATKKGLEYAVKHPEEAVDIYIGLFPEAKANRTNSLNGWKAQIKEFQYDKSLPYKEKGEDWKASQEMMFNIGLITKKTDVSAMFTNKFIPK